MLTKPTVFIIGAGASFEGGFPTGPTLATRIADLFPEPQGRFGIGQISNDEISQAIFAHITQEKQKMGTPIYHHLDTRDIQPFRDAAMLLKQGIILANSIDDFLHLHAHNSQLQLISKIAIAYSIQQAEKASKLQTRHNGLWLSGNFRELQNTYYVKLFKLISKGVSASQIEGVFKNCVIISFNYDRSLEYFLLNALSALYKIDLPTAGKVMANLNIYHPYGTVGTIPELFRSGGSSSYYGNILQGSALLEISSSIQTYTEKVTDEEAIQELKLEIQNCVRLVFLGFGFHQQNIDLIRPDKIGLPKEMYVTAYKIPSPNIDTIRDILGAFIESDGNMWEARKQINISNDYTCADLFDNFYFPLGRS